MEKFLGFDIGGTKCAVVLGDCEGNVEKKIRFETTDFTATLNALLEAGEELFEADVAALCVAFNGYVERKTMV